MKQLKCNSMVSNLENKSTIRWMIRKDLPDIVKIEATSQIDALSVQNLVVCLAKKNMIGLVANKFDKNLQKDIIVGYAIYEMNKSSIKIQRIGVHHLYQRMGIGTQLVSRILGLSIDNKPVVPTKKNTTVDIILRETNLEAQLFFRSQKFKAVEILKKSFDDTLEDGYLMRHIPSSVLYL
jgi:ribosomal-protein-alanine N-acetyltransferase